jgi:hypothetical protein
MSIAFLVSLASLAWVWWKYHIYRKPDEQGRRANGASQWLFARDALLYGMLALLTASHTLLGVYAMFIPEPVRPQVQEQTNVMSLVFIALAVVVAAFSVANLWIGITAFRGKKK